MDSEDTETSGISIQELKRRATESHRGHIDGIVKKLEKEGQIEVDEQGFCYYSGGQISYL